MGSHKWILSEGIYFILSLIRMSDIQISERWLYIKIYTYIEITNNLWENMQLQFLENNE